MAAAVGLQAQHQEISPTAGRPIGRGQTETMPIGPSDERWDEIIVVLYPAEVPSSGCWRGLNIKRAPNCGWPPCRRRGSLPQPRHRRLVGLPGRFTS